MKRFIRGSCPAPARSRLAISFLAMCLVMTSSSPASAADDLRLDGNVVPTFQSISLVLDADKKDYTGSVHIELDVKQRTNRIRFHAEEMKLETIELRRAGGSPSRTPIELDIKNRETGLVEATAKDALEPGAYTLDIEFANDFGTRAVGLYRMVQDGQGYLFTQFEASDAREAFPCWDEPGFKIPYQMEIEIPSGHMVVSNTPIEKETAQNGAKRVLFRKTKPLPSYLLAIATGPFETVDVPGMSIPGRVVTIRGQSHLAGEAVKLAPPLLASLERWFDRKYPYEKLDFIAVPEYAHGAMENPGAVTFLASLLLLDPDSMSARSRRSLASVMAHEMAHMWFGNLVTMKWWDDLWLNESFADWMGDKIAAEVCPEYKIALGERQSVQNVMSRDARPSAEAIHQPIETTDDPTKNVGTQYNKGKAVLGMFERWVGPEKFRQGVLHYIDSHAWGNATSADLWKALSVKSGNDVTAAMATFLDQAGLPLVSAEIELDGRVKLTQKRFLNVGAKAPSQIWQVPVALKYSDGKTTRTETVLLRGEEDTVSLKSDGPIAWLMPDADGSGYYRWSVPEPMLEQLAAGGEEILNAPERMSFLGNLGALLDAGALHGDEYMRAVSHFASDSEPMALGALASALEKAKFAFVPDDLSGPFAVYIERTLRPVMERIGFEKRPGETEDVSLVRPTLLEWLGREAGDHSVMARANEAARLYASNPAEVDASLVSISLQLSALHGDRNLWNEYRERFERAENPAARSHYLRALGRFSNPELVEETLRYALWGPLRAQEVLRITEGLRDTEQGRERLYRWVTENYEAILERIPPPRAGSLPLMARGCDAQRLEAARAFFAEPDHVKPGTAESLAKVADEIQDCVDLRAREGAAVAAYLNELAGSR